MLKHKALSNIIYLWLYTLKIFSCSLHLTTMCLRHPPKIVACVCIHLACKWSNYKIPLSRLKKEWFMHVLEPNWSMDSITTLNLLEELTNEFLTIFEQCPSRLKKKIMASTQAVSIYKNHASTSYFYLLYQNRFLFLNSIFQFNIRPSKKRNADKTRMFSLVITSQISLSTMNQPLQVEPLQALWQLF